MTTKRFFISILIFFTIGVSAIAQAATYGQGSYGGGVFEGSAASSTQSAAVTSGATGGGGSLEIGTGTAALISATTTAFGTTTQAATTTPLIISTSTVEKIAAFTAPVEFLIRDLYFGVSSETIKELQRLLAKDKNIYPEGLITGFFGSSTKIAIIRFQEKYKDEILTPIGLTKGTGFIGKLTRKKLNELFAKEKPKISELAPELPQEQSQTIAEKLKTIENAVKELETAIKQFLLQKKSAR